MKRTFLLAIVASSFVIASFASPILNLPEILASRISGYAIGEKPKPKRTRSITGAGVQAELFISEYIEGSSFNKAIEIYNSTGTTINLGTDGYVLDTYFNGNSTVGLSINLIGTVAHGEAFVIAQSTADPAILAVADQTNGSPWFNGDDAIVLRKGATVIDSIGRVGEDPGTEWGIGPDSTADNTLVRDGFVCLGDTVIDDIYQPELEWSGYAADDFTYLGTHSGGCTVPEISATGGPLNFGNQAVNVTSSSLSVTVQNTGTADLVLGTPAFITGTQFAVVTDPNGTVLGPTETTTIEFTFTPTSIGTKNDTVTITSNAPGPAPAVTLTGQGVQANSPTVQASGITFSNVDYEGMSVNWTNGDGEKRIVVINTENSFTDPVNGTDPTSVNYSGLGQAVIYNSDGSSLLLDGDLYSGVTYYLRVYEYNGSGATTEYLTTTAAGNPNSQATDLATITISDVTNAETNSGETTFTFNVNKFGTAGGSVDWQVNAVAPTDGTDLPLPQSGTIVIPPTSPGAGALTPINVTVNGDTEFEPDETFTVDLSTSSTDLNIFDNQAIGTIQNDDVEPRTFIVDRLDDSVSADECLDAVPNDCSLRRAVETSNDGDTITFDPAIYTQTGLAPEGTPLGVIELAGTEIPISTDITITGPGANLLTVNGNSTSRIFSISGSSATITGVTLTGGNGLGPAFNGDGGAILVYAGGTLSMDSVNVSGNTAGSEGGGISLLSGPNSIVNSTISSNQSGSFGGGLYYDANAVVTTISNTTISDNFAVDGGGIHAENGTLTLRALTITLNEVTAFSGSGGGIRVDGAAVNIGNSIIAGNLALFSQTEIDNNNSGVTSAGFNLIGDSAGDAANTGLPITYLATDIVDTDPLLGPLQNNGGPTPTHAFNLSLGLSTAIDKGSAFGLTTDQRGLNRTVDFGSIDNATGGDGTDIGAYELMAPTAAPASISGRVLTRSGAGIRGAVITIQGMDGGVWSVTTNTFGRYEIGGLTAGASYVVTVSSRRYMFANGTQLISLDDNITGLDFTATQ